MHLVVVAPRCWPDPHPAATLTWHLAQALQARGIRVSVVGWKSWPGEPDQTAVGAVRFLRLLRPQGIFSSLRASRELALLLRRLLDACDAVVVLDPSGELQPAIDLAVHEGLPLALWLDRAPCRQVHRGPHRWLLRRPAIPRQATLLCSGPWEEQFARRHYAACGPIRRIAKGVPLPASSAGSSSAEARRMLTRCWPHISLEDADHLVLIGPPGAARKHWSWVQQLARLLKHRLAARVGLALLSDVDEPAVCRWTVPGAGPVVSLLPFHDWGDLFRATDACLWLPLQNDVPYFALYAMAAACPLLAPRVPETEYLLGRECHGLRLPWQPLELWCAALAEAFRRSDRIVEVTRAARQHVATGFTYEAMVRGVFQGLGLPLPKNEKTLVG